MLRSKSRSGYVEVGQKKHSSFLLRTISGSKICRGDSLASQVDKAALVSVERNSVSLAENRIVKAAIQQKQINSLEEELKNTKVRLDESETERNRVIAELNEVKEMANAESAKLIGELKKRIVELEDEVEKTKQSEAHMLEALMLQTQQIEQTKMDLEESKLEVKHLNKELQSQNASGEQVARLQEEIRKLNRELALQKDKSERLRMETEESVSSWTAKEMGFIGCINKAYEENASLIRENKKLHEALVASENTTKITREETSKLRDIVKQALNESKAAKEASNIARAEHSELKDLLSKKEESLRALTEENEKLRINEVAARENLKEFKRLLAAKTEANKHYEANKHCEDKEHTEVFNSPVASLYEDHLDGRTIHQQMFSFDDFKFKKEEDDDMLYHEADHAEAFVDIDPEKAEALKGSIFDTDVSPKSEPRTPKTKGNHRRSATAGHFEEADHHGHHTEDGEDKGYYLYGLYHRKRLFKKIGELIVGKNKEHAKEQGKEHAKEQGKEHVKEQGKEHVKEQGKEQVKEQGKEHAKEQGKEQVKEQGKEQVKEQSKEQES
ncbi:hypothetical protein HanRHA438_Chr07g0301301 [Helianthus annuus]|uniref:WEB family n=1 Tax=Helianthus annuus TaxID=4232 RepID=A0A251TP61_HELAN|nr:uncharacterized protein PF11_0207 [Helianthus annuus]KAF5798259.1 hypothetical protein HanXRQr2_Chr07g0290771 [Helianthus annuus]KAJ0549883.1 hypothetical protein HanHA300_Chr07g0239111 [Helianthus annuus]KAJ0562842.1 hypothetical protein HanHA89_Chr07g0256321 [Helianthus annuus]KAJ0730982.1 hypothetical protein HanOQP8_Chr07g0246711 [Helianthus annuus]KAJ0904382.1 hypothetical protein HanPSC8_Chr07g0281511 [Helianthus annuus]